MAAVLASVPDAETTVDADVLPPGITAAEITVAANLFSNHIGGIFGCPSCYDIQPPLLEYLKLFLPFFPLHIQKLVQMYLKTIEMMNTFEMLQNMMNHMDEYQALFQMFENNAHGNSSNMPDFSSLQKMMEGSDLVDEFTYVEEPSGTSWNGS